jgi:hypothetical protein
MRFITSTLNGKLLYADDFLYIDDENMNTEPNIYHQNLVMQTQNYQNFEITDKRFPIRHVDQATTTSSSTKFNAQISKTEKGYPWNIDSSAPNIAEILCNYRNYKIPKLALSRCLQARINEGFSVVKIRAGYIPQKTSSKIEITLALVFAPNITVLYTIKFTWHQNTEIKSSILNYVPQKSIRVDINVLAHHAFAILFINIHSYEASKANMTKAALNSKLSSLHDLLKGISESDETLQVNVY